MDKYSFDPASFATMDTSPEVVLKLLSSFGLKAYLQVELAGHAWSVRTLKSMVVLV